MVVKAALSPSLPTPDFLPSSLSSSYFDCSPWTRQRPCLASTHKYPLKDLFVSPLDFRPVVFQGQFLFLNLSLMMVFPHPLSVAVDFHFGTFSAIHVRGATPSLSSCFLVATCIHSQLSYPLIYPFFPHSFDCDISTSPKICPRSL